MDYELTTNHASSSYGIPVLVVDGKSFGAMDTLPNGEIAFYFINKTEDSLKEKFLKSAPDLYFSL